MEWKYERVEQKFDQLAVGKYRLRIKDVEKAISNTSGNDMLVITFDVSGSNQTLRHYIPFLADKPEVTNRMLTQFFDSFGIDGDFNLEGWKGKCGACQTKMEEYNGEDRAKISYFIAKNKQDDLPPWQDNNSKKKIEDLPEVSGEDLPF